METIESVDVRHFKLTNGENIICYVQSTTEHAFIVERPAAVQASPAGIWSFVDWFPFSDKKIYKLMKRFVINHTEVVTETKESYIKYSCHDEIKDISYDTDEYSDEYSDVEYDMYDIDTSDKKTVH